MLLQTEKGADSKTKSFFKVCDLIEKRAEKG